MLVFLFLAACTDDPGEMSEEPVSPTPNQAPSPAQQGDLWRTITSPMKSVYREGNPASVVLVSGRWRLDGSTGRALFSPVPVVNTVQIFCNRSAGACSERLAILDTPLDGERYLRSIRLETMAFDYQIVEWTADRITARYEAPVVDLEIVIHLDRDEVERTWREVPERGGTASVFGHWIVE